MLDYQELKIKFTERLNTFSKEDLIRWLEFERNRSAVSDLIAGETVNIENSTLSQLIQIDKIEKVSFELGESNYTMAA